MPSPIRAEMLSSTMRPIFTERLRRACIETIWPICPSSIACLAKATRGSNRQMCPTMKMPGAPWPPPRGSGRSRPGVGAIGFSRNTCLPLRKRVDGDVAMVVDVRGDADHVDRPDRPASRGSRCSAWRRGNGRPLPPAVADGACTGRPVRCPACVAKSLGMHLAEPAQADDAPADVLHRFGLLFPAKICFILTAVSRARSRSGSTMLGRRQNGSISAVIGPRVLDLLQGGFHGVEVHIALQQVVAKSVQQPAGSRPA